MFHVLVGHAYDFFSVWNYVYETPTLWRENDAFFGIKYASNIQNTQFKLRVSLQIPDFEGNTR